LGLFVLGRILRLVEREWDPGDAQSGPTRRAVDAMARDLLPALTEYLDAAEDDRSYDQLNALVRAFLAWEARRD